MKQYFVFTNNEQEFALDIRMIERIIEFKEPKRVPDSSPWLLGVIEYNGMVVPVIDLTNRLYNVKVQYKQAAKIIIIVWEDRHIGLAVEEVQGVEKFDESQHEILTEDTQVSKEYVSGFILKEEEIIIILYTEALFSLQQKEELLLVGEE